jgi:hypothetical protein
MATVPDRPEDFQCDLDPFIPDATVAPSEPRLPFPEWIRLAGSMIRFHGDGSSASTWLAAKIDAIAEEAVLLQARCPAEFDARLEVMERGREFDLYHQAEVQGYDACLKAHFLQSCYQ